MIENILPKRVRGVKLYDPQRPPVEYDLSDNTNQWPLSPAVLQSISNAGNTSRYPDIYGLALKEKLAELYSLKTENFVIGCGTDDVLDCIVRALSDEGDLISVPNPSFPMAKYFGEFNGRTINEFELNADGSIDVERIDDNSKIIYLCTPNNPTGQVIPKENIEQIINLTRSFIVIDEAYAEFAENNCLDLLNNPRVLITRTFSKIFGLAGLRIGYAIGQVEVIAAVEALRGPYKANTVGLSAAIESIEEKDYYQELLDELKQTRDWFSGALIGFGLDVVESESNFVFVRGEFSSDLKEKLKMSGFSIRQFLPGDIYGIEGIRITLAPKEVLEKFLVALKESL